MKLQILLIITQSDYNVPGINWDTESVDNHNYPISISQALFQMSVDYGCTQLVNFPTKNDNILDLQQTFPC